MFRATEGARAVEGRRCSLSERDLPAEDAEKYALDQDGLASLLSSGCQAKPRGSGLWVRRQGKDTALLAGLGSAASSGARLGRGISDPSASLWFQRRGPELAQWLSNILAVQLAPEPMAHRHCAVWVV